MGAPVTATSPPGAALLAGPAGRELLRVATAHAGAELIDTQLRSVHERAGRSLSHVHAATLRTGDRTRDVLLVAHTDARGLPEGAFVLEAEGVRVAVWRFPHDPYLPGLPSAIDVGRVRDLLDDLGAPPGSVTLRTRAYRPARRAVIEVEIATADGPGRALYLKLLAGDRAEELADLHRQLAPHVPVPRVLGTSPSQGLVALEALDGTTLRAALVDPAVPLPSAEDVVALSRRIAASRLTSRRDPTAFADPTRHVDGLLRHVPDLAAEVRRVALAAGRLDGPRVPVHGDLHDGQLLLGPEGAVTGLLDVDGAGPGLVAHDAGNLLAHVEVVGALWPEVADRCVRHAADLRAAYLEVVPDRDLAVATAGAWLSLATGPHRAQEPGWEASTRARIDRAIEVFEGG